MQLLIALAIAGIVGYLLAGSRYGRKIEQTTEQISESSESLLERSKRWLRERFGREKPQDNFVAWASGKGSAHFPKEFTEWLKGLSPEEAARFTSSLSTHAESLNFDLDELVSGEMENKPALMQVFVEAVVVYSHEYRKAQEAQSEASKADREKAGQKKAAEPSPSDGKAVAEKQPSRRKGAVEDSPQAAGAA